MEENKIMSPQIKGLIISLFLIIISIAGYYAGLSFEKWFGWAVNGLFFIAIIIACVHFANQKENYVNFGSVFMHGFKITLVVTVIFVIYTILAMTVLFPEMKEKIFEMQQAEMEKQDMDSAQIETAMNFMRNNFMWLSILFILFFDLVMGCIASLIGAAVAKKKPINPMTSQGGI